MEEKVFRKHSMKAIATRNKFQSILNKEQKLFKCDGENVEIDPNSSWDEMNNLTDVEITTEIAILNRNRERKSYSSYV